MEEEKVEVLEEKTPKKNGLGPGFMVILVVLFLVGGVLGFAASKLIDEPVKKDDTEEKETKKDKKEEEKVTFSDEELKKYVDYISPISIGPSEKIYNTSSVDASKLSAREKIEYIGTHVFEAKEMIDMNTATTRVKESKVKELVEQVYGPGTYERTTFNLGCGDYTYEEAEKGYTTRGGCGGTTGSIAEYAVVDYKATDRKLEITTSYVIKHTDKLYKDMDLKEYIEDYNDATDETMESKLIEYAKTNKDKLHHIVYTFESKDGRNYYFTGFKNNK